MPRYCRSLSVVEAHIWHKNGDHPNDECETFIASMTDMDAGLRKGDPFKGEGKVVRYYRRPDISGSSFCITCDKTMHEHGWIDNGGTGIDVCPGDIIITKAPGVYEAMSYELFRSIYDVEI